MGDLHRTDPIQETCATAVDQADDSGHTRQPDSIDHTDQENICPAKDLDDAVVIDDLPDDLCKVETRLSKNVGDQEWQHIRQIINSHSS